MAPVPRDGETLGEVMFRGNVVMKGYLKNKAATEAAFAGGWFHSGDLGVIHPDGYIQLKDRSKDIIISGGENISSIEVEDALYKHPAVQVVAVVAKPDEKWGETPCAFVELKAGASGDRRGTHGLVPPAPRLLQMPAHHRVRGNPENLDRQIAEIQAAGCGEGDVTSPLCRVRETFQFELQIKSSAPAFAGTRDEYSRCELPTSGRERLALAGRSRL